MKSNSCEMRQHLISCHVHKSKGINLEAQSCPLLDYRGTVKCWGNVSKFKSDNGVNLKVVVVQG